ncbi:MAG TPA: hypothetical protein VGP76_25630 [Planctomycetaceae bacterium]|jgi:hypothetical protein|nr:hypothetical protein [Planctomycetaceae bacterium]
MINGQTISHAGEWRACGGEVRKLVQRLRWRRRGQQARQFAAIVFVAVVPFLCFTPYAKLFLTSQIELKVAAAPCGYYEDEMRAYYCDKSRSDLPAELWVHLSHCRDCSRDLVFYGGISQCMPDRAAVAKHAAHMHHGPQQRVTLMQVLTEGTLAVQR